VIALALAACACGRIDFDPRADAGAEPRCSWSQAPRLQNERLRTELSTPLTDSDPIFVRGDPLTITLTTIAAGNLDLFTAHRPSVDADFEQPTLVTDLSTPGDELALQIDTTGHGYFVKDIANDTDLYEVQRVGGTLQIVRALTELNDTMRQHDPHFTADGLSLWFATATPTANQDLMIAHRPDTSSTWTNVEPFPFNTSGGDASATLTDDQLLAVWASRSLTGTFNDIWYATRPTVGAPWSAPQQLPLATDTHELEPSIRGDGCELLFARASTPTDMNWEIYSVDID